jgi:hypothetical protein
MTTRKRAMSCPVDDLVLLCNAIAEACREIQRCPDESITDIFNEALDQWCTGLRMDHNFNVKPNKQGGCSE